MQSGFAGGGAGVAGEIAGGSGQPRGECGVAGEYVVQAARCRGGGAGNPVPSGVEQRQQSGAKKDMAGYAMSL